MIKAEELRVGNLYLNMGIIDAFTRHNYFQDYPDWEPIPLTPEWLERCGFKGSAQFKGGTLIIEAQAELDIRIREDNITKYILPFSKTIQIEYVHQLQNVYRDLTGEELQIKMP